MIRGVPGNLLCHFGLIQLHSELQDILKYFDFVQGQLPFVVTIRVKTFAL